MSIYFPVKLAFNVYEPEEKNQALGDVILVHAFLSCKEVWTDIAREIADKTNRTVYAPDMRNHGDSSWSEVCDPKTMAQDLSFFMDEHKIKSAVLIGHSMGGFIAMHLALAEPEKIQAIIIGEATVKTYHQSKNKKKAMIYADLFQRCIEDIPSPFEINDLEAHKIVIDNMCKLVFMEKEITPAKLRLIELITLPITKKKGRYVWKANIGTINRKSVEKESFFKGTFEKPALFIYGDLSHLELHKEEKLIKSFFFKAKMKEIKNATHSLFFEHPKEFTEACIDFVVKLENNI